MKGGGTPWAEVRDADGKVLGVTWRDESRSSNKNAVADGEQTVTLIAYRSAMNTEKLRAQALDLNRSAPRSPYVALGNEFPAVAARLVDKCRAELLGQSGAYHYNCPMDRQFFVAVRLEAEPLREFIATGADDNEVAAWMRTHARAPREKIIKWGRRFRMNPLWRLLEFEDWLHQRHHGRPRG